MTLDRKPAIPTQVIASRDPEMDGVYYIGPTASRLNFSSQQRRAFGLVGDIHDSYVQHGRPKGLAGLNVCIVGAGLAGLSSALAVAAFGGRAYILEKSACDEQNPKYPDEESCALSTFSKARHRYGHPNLNFWPWEKIDPLTRLPALNWTEGACPNIAEQILENYSSICSSVTVLQNIKGIRNGCLVKGVREINKYDKKYKVLTSVTDKSSTPWDLEYDIVIFATGYGIEFKLNNYDSGDYWDFDNDAIEFLARNKDIEADNFVVSGTGDGGLIDIIRFLFEGINPGSLDESIVASLYDENLTNSVLNIEASAFRKYSNLIHVRQSASELRSLQNEISNFLWNEYLELVKTGINDQFVEMLKSRRISLIPKVISIGLSETPLELNSAPFHRLIITIAITMGWLKYIQVKNNWSILKGEMGVASKRKINLAEIRCFAISEISAKHETPTISNRDAKRENIGALIELNSSFLIVRHGYNSPLTKVMNKTKFEKIRHIQMLYADQDQLNPLHAKIIAAALNEHDPTDEDFINSKWSMIKSYFNSNFKLEPVFDKNTNRIQIVNVMEGDLELTRALPRIIGGCPVDGIDNIKRTVRTFSSSGRKP